MSNIAARTVTALGNFAESVGNKIAYGEFGTDDDPLVENAKL